MNEEQKKLLFYFIEEVESNNETEDTIHNKQKYLLEELEKISESHEDLKETVIKLSDSMVDLCEKIKNQYFEYGIIAKDVHNTHILD